MKLILIVKLFISSTLSELLPAVYTISNAEYTNSILAVSSLQINNNKPEVALANSGLEDLKQWKLTNTSAGWTIRCPTTQQYLAPNGNGLRLSTSLPYSWWISQGSGEGYTISAAPNHLAIALQSASPASNFYLQPITKAPTQKWLFTLIN